MTFSIALFFFDQQLRSEAICVLYQGDYVIHNEHSICLCFYFPVI